MISQEPYIKINGVGRIKRAPDTIVPGLFT